MICAYEKCNNDFISKTHNQKYCSDECCRIATNIKIKEKYRENKDRKRGKIRFCSNAECNNKLSRYNENKICWACEDKNETENTKNIIRMLKNVSS